MSKYALVTVQDREITITMKDTLKDAQDKMLEELKECPDWEDWQENFKMGEETEKYFIGQTLGYANADDGDMDIDWSIFEVFTDFVLVECINREISLIQFNTINEANKYMLERFTKLCEEEEIEFEFGEETYTYGINEYSAYLNANDGDVNYDWCIFKVNENDIKIITVEAAISIFKNNYKIDVIDEETLSNENFVKTLEEKLKDCEIDENCDEAIIVDIIIDMLRIYQYGDTSDADDISLIEEDLSNRYVSNL